MAACGGRDEEESGTTTASPPPTASPTTTHAETAAPEPVPPDFVVGAVDDAARNPGPVLQQLADAGFNALGISSYWEPGLTEPTAAELAVLGDTAARATDEQLRVFVKVFHRGSRTTPLTDAARAQFAAYVAAIVRQVPQIGDVIVGNEPNLNRFWLPQFGPNGENVASGAYFALLAQAYDAAKAADADVRIWGGALAPRGVDRPGTGRDTQSPTLFLDGLGDAYRSSGRTRPPLDGFAFHPYPESSAVPPDRAAGGRNLGLAEHERLRELVRGAFGADLPILYAELGVETHVPDPKRGLYEGDEPADPVDEKTQAEYYRRALELAACQEGVVGILLFHSHDEPVLAGFQSGVYYVDGTPKTSLEPVRQAIRAAQDGC